MLALCAGVGGLELGVHLAYPQSRVVCYVEREAASATILAARMEDGYLPAAPIWSDITTFNARPWRGLVDCITAGFPCQPWSVAGARRGTADERWIWDSIATIIRDVGPRFVFLENVPGLLVSGLGHVLWSLAEMGFAAEWGVFGVDDLGGPQRRERVFVLGYADQPGELQPERALKGQRGRIDHASQDMAHPRRLGERGLQPERESGGGSSALPGRARTELADSGSPRSQVGAVELARAECAAPERGGHEMGGDDYWPPGPRDPRWAEIDPELWPIEPPLRGVADGVPPRLDRLRALGNGVCPVAAAVAFATLATRAGVEV